MKTFSKRILSLILCLSLALAAAPALAGIEELDTAVAGWLNPGQPIGSTVTLELKKWLPFGEAIIQQMNGVLSNAALHLWMSEGDAQSVTAARLSLGESDLFSLAETQAYGQYELDTSLLPKLTLTSASGSPIELLTGSAPTAYLADSPDVEDIDEPFTLLGALDELALVYPTLSGKLKADTARKKASYNIKGIGAGKYSYVLKLEGDQLADYQPLVAQALGSGMNDSYRDQLAGITLVKGFTIAVYQNKDEADIALYMKGSFKTADEITYKLKYQWAFLDEGLERSDQYTYETTKSGATDSRVISAKHQRTSRTDTLKLSVSSTCTLKRGLAVDIYTDKISLSGANDGAARTIGGEINRNRRHEKSGDQHYTLTTYTPELTLTGGQTYAELTGSCGVKQEKDKRATTSLTLTFGPITDEAFQAAMESGDPASLAALTDTEAQAMAALQPSVAQTSSVPQSSLSQNNDERPAETPAPAKEPTGIPPYETPDEPATLAFDTLAAEERTQYQQWAEQNMAIRLILCMLTLPEDDQQLLYTALTSDDLQEAQQLFGNLNAQ